MQHALIDIGTGAIMGGLALSAGWGLLWLAVSSIGLSRGTCHWRVVVNSLAVGAVPLLLAWALVSIRAETFSPTIAFVVGLSVMPLILTGLALRPGPGGRPAGAHLLQGIRRLIDELLGKHHECDGCGHDHGADLPGGSA
jgi:hypothetical protein